MIEYLKERIEYHEKMVNEYRGDYIGEREFRESEVVAILKNILKRGENDEKK